jgi:arsenate reductase-like glutaredoxin family protein
MTCKRAQGFLDAQACVAVETVDAKKHRIGPAEALRLLKGIRNLVVIGRNKRVVTHDLDKARPDDEVLASLMIGPSGNLRAPTVRIGETLIIGYDEETYRKLFRVK